jgi:hypothetical protein
LFDCICRTLCDHHSSSPNGSDIEAFYEYVSYECPLDYPLFNNFSLYFDLLIIEQNVVASIMRIDGCCSCWFKTRVVVMII